VASERPIRDADPPSRARLGDAIRVGVVGFIEELVTFLAANVAWAVLVGAVVYASLRWPLALLLAPLAAPLTSGIARVAAEVARDRVVSLPTFVAGVRERFWTKLALGAVQIVVLVIALADLLLAPAIGGLPAIASMVLAFYVGLSSIAYGLVFWTLLNDPELRTMAARQIARLALAVVLRRPGPVAFFLAYTVLAIGVMSTLVVPILFLPSIVLLTVAAYVLPAAEEIRQGR
jgi:hypothetical protein